MSEPPLHNIIFTVINNKWQASWIEGECVSHRDLKWYEWPYLRYLQTRDFLSAIVK